MSLPTVRVGEIAPEESRRRWLIEGLWGASAVGFLSGAPKSGKSWLGLDMALSVATQTRCLGRFRILEPGRALAYLAEDALPVLRERVEAMANHRGVTLSRLDLYVITTPSLRLDRPEDRVRLWQTVRDLKPRLLLLDPLVRLHSLDENSCREISGLLSYLRELQRRLDVAVVVVHHTRKHGAPGAQAGQGLRGSSDLWAWADSNLYLRRFEGKLLLSMEHRAARPPDPVCLRLVDADAERIHLEVVAGRVEKQAKPPIRDAVLDALREEPSLTRTQLRDRLRVKNEKLGAVLLYLEREGRIARGPNGLRLMDPKN